MGEKSEEEISAVRMNSKLYHLLKPLEKKFSDEYTPMAFDATTEV